MKLTVYQRRLLARLADPAVKLEYGYTHGQTGYYLCRWDGAVNHMLGQPSLRVVAPLIAAGLLQPAEKRAPWVGVWFELSAAGKEVVRAMGLVSSSDPASSKS